MRRHHRFLLACALALAACSSQDRTRLAVTVYSDLTVPTEIDSLRIEVQGPTGTTNVEYVLATQPTPGRFVLPVQTVLVPQGQKDDAFTVVASGIKDRTAVVTRSAQLSFFPGEAHELIIFLNRDCYNRTCEGKDKTCVAGACVANGINTHDLPPYVTNKTGSAPSPDASLRTGDTAADTAGIEGGREVGTLPPADARWPDATIAPSREEAGVAADAPAVNEDTGPDVPWNPNAEDAAVSSTDAASPTVHDTASSSLTPDTVLADSKTTLDLVSTVDTVAPSDTPVLPSPDAALPEAPVVSPDTLPLSPDTATDVPCPTSCTQGAKRCGTSGVQTCIVLANGCTTWDVERPCGTHQSCQGNEPTAACQCKASGSSKCPLPGSTTGNFCESTELLQSCNRDGDGCYYLGTPQTCSALKPCSGADGAASCSCGQVTAPCGTDVGTFCNASNTQVFSCAYQSSCMVTTPGETCPADKPCAQTGGTVAECKCPTVPECDSAQEINQSYCSSNTLVTCSATASNCQQVNKTDCRSNQTCKNTGGSASCECVKASCEDSQGHTFSNQTCEGETSVLTCGTVESCPAITSTTTCASGTVCRPSGVNASCLAVYGWYTDLGSIGSRGSATLMGYPITVTAAGTLSKIAVLVKSLPVTSPVSVKIGVYSDPADGAALLTKLENTISVGPNELTPSPTIPLVAGHVYWVFAVYSVDGVEIGQTQTAMSIRFQNFSYGNPLPTSMNGTGGISGKQSNYYLLVSP
jgi:hypothetical protein